MTSPADNNRSAALFAHTLLLSGLPAVYNNNDNDDDSTNNDNDNDKK